MLEYPSPRVTGPLWKKLSTLFVIIALHAALLAVLLRTAGPAVTHESSPLEVTILSPDTPAARAVTLAAPRLMTPALPLAAMPDVVLADAPPVAAAVTPDALTVAPVPTPVATPVAAASDPSPVSMSEIGYLRQPAPHYPPAARHAREEGLVVLRVTIDAGGRVQAIAVYRSSGHPRLDEAAKDAVALALFKPCVAGGVPRTAVAMIPIEFSLRS